MKNNSKKRLGLARKGEPLLSRYHPFKMKEGGVFKRQDLFPRGFRTNGSWSYSDGKTGEREKRAKEAKKKVGGRSWKIRKEA